MLVPSSTPSLNNQVKLTPGGAVYLSVNHVNCFATDTEASVFWLEVMPKIMFILPRAVRSSLFLAEILKDYKNITASDTNCIPTAIKPVHTLLS
ncbi:MAG: hypothetical protein CMP47_01560 [Rickettsiales bacterium]|nr:hypothetical protein [Rickettsiales bacterium]